ncbi:MAG: amidohydrolase [Spirochaetaceae bacterium]|nr:MAG: amidohydrolase [Spirochaetaceae bacterium]
MKISREGKGRNRYLDAANEILETMLSIRRDLHSHPELGMQETRTARIIADRLKALDLEVRTGVGGTGVVGLLRGSGKGKIPAKTVALRADIDALPMQDQKSVEYASKNPGIAHSCGHDAHTAIQLGAAEILSRSCDVMAGNVKFIFQPSEDTLPGGAVPMIEAGVLENPKVDAISSLHLGSQFEEGTVVAKAENVSTSSVSFDLDIHGKGGHIGEPHRVINPVLLAATLITSSQTLLPKRTAPGDPIIFDFCAVHGGTVGNIIPDQVNLKGGIRVASPELLEQMMREFERMIQGIVENGGASYSLRLQEGYPTIYNDPPLLDLWQAAAGKVVGTDKVILHERIITGGDDAAFFHQRVPGVYWFLGVHNERGGYTEPLHSPHFDFNEEVLAIGAAVQAQVATDYLKRQ